MEALDIRRPQPARPRQRPLLHQDQDGDIALAFRHQRGSGIRHSDHEVTLRPMILSEHWPIVTRAVMLLAAPALLASCTSDRLPAFPGFGSDAATTAAAPPPAPARVPPPVDLAGRW